MIETVEVTPDTVVRLINGHRYVVVESFDDIRDAIVDFRKKAGYTCIPSGMPLRPEDSNRKSE
jgi:flagellar protein FlbD